MTPSIAAHVAPVHGGLAQPVNRIQPRERVLFPNWKKLPPVEIN